MSWNHARYFLVALIATALAAAAVGGLIVSLSAAAAGAALIGGWWTNLAVTGAVGILAGRKVAAVYTDPRLGKVAGTAVGVWVGLGAALGLLAFAWFVANVYRAEVRASLAVIFATISAIIAIIAATIAGRETAHPPEEEEA